MGADEVQQCGAALHCVSDFQSFVDCPILHSGHYMYRQFNIQRFHVLPTQCFCMFYVDLTAIISLYYIN